MRAETCTAASALRFVEAHGIVLASAKGPAPRLIDAIAGEAIEGNWWRHPNARAIYNVLAETSASDRVLVCRLIDDKITLVHRRLWPALVRLAPRFSPRRIARVEEVHTASGRHETRELPFPGWVPREVVDEASRLSDDAATAALGSIAASAGTTRGRS